MLHNKSFLAFAISIFLFISILSSLYAKTRKKSLKSLNFSKKGLISDNSTCYTVSEKVMSYIKNIRQRNKGVKGMDKKTERVTIFDIADWFLLKEPMTHKKLQKLCYYAQAWSLVLRGTNVADDVEFQAWVHGPVNYSLWRRFREYGYETIAIKQRQTKTLNPEINALLERVWDTYGELTGYQLESLTHSELPWQDARKGLAEDAPSNRLIDQGKIESYYQSIYSGDGIGE